ncbi:PaaI family thioesterase [Flavobacteriales bacterium]|nr:PaaI family thioesterase [Flavobacteriales bacterium]
MKNTDLTQLNASSKNTMMETLGIEYTQVGEDFICGKMPVDNRTHQPMGIMHGGASAALIETLGSIGSHLLIDSETEFSSGLDLNINHIRAVRSGFVHGKATLVHKGKTTHVWQVDITNEENKLVSTGRLTVFVGKK